MSEQINRVLADRAQNFSTAQQKQARDNIGAAASADLTNYATTAQLAQETADRASADSILQSAINEKLDSSASSQFYLTSNPAGYITGVDLSPYQTTAGMSSYVPYSAISSDSANNVTSINGSAVGVFTGVSAGNNLTGSGTTSSPLGLSNKVRLVTALGTASSTAEYDGEGFSATGDDPVQSAYYNGTAWQITTKGADTHWHYLGVSGGTSIYLNYNSNYYINRIAPSSMTLTDEWYPARYTAQYALGGVTLCDNSANSATLNTAALTFADSAGTAQVDRTSIDRWNSIPTGATATHETVVGFGDTADVISANVYETAYNVVARSVSASGLPELVMYGFGSLPGTALGPCSVDGNGVFRSIPQNNYYCHIETATSAPMDTSWLPTGVTGMAKAEFANASNGDINIKTDTFNGNTADIHPGEVHASYYHPGLDRWIDLNTL